MSLEYVAEVILWYYRSRDNKVNSKDSLNSRLGTNQNSAFGA